MKELFNTIVFILTSASNDVNDAKMNDRTRFLRLIQSSNFCLSKLKRK